jgi:hypothetical protein
MNLLSYNVLTSIYSLFFYTSSTSSLIKNGEKLIIQSERLCKIDSKACLNARLVLTNNKIKNLEYIHILKCVSSLFLGLFLLVGPFLKYTQATIPDGLYDSLYFLTWCSSVIYALFFLVNYSDSKINLERYKAHILNQLNNNIRLKRSPNDLIDINSYQTLPITKKINILPLINENNVLPLEIESIDNRSEKENSEDISNNSELKCDIQPISLDSEKHIKSLNFRAEAKIPCGLFLFLEENYLIKHSDSPKVNSFIHYHFLGSKKGTQFSPDSIRNQFSLLRKQDSKPREHYMKFIEHLKRCKKMKHAVVTSSRSFNKITQEYSELLYKPLSSSFNIESPELLDLILKLYFEVCFSKEETTPIVRLTPDEYAQFSKLRTE